MSCTYTCAGARFSGYSYTAAMGQWRSFKAGLAIDIISHTSMYTSTTVLVTGYI